ncbi:hypothetical protein D3C71_1782260 [compost metagenome]
MPLTRQMIFSRQVQVLHSFAVAIHVGEIVLAKHVGHHLRRQLLPHFRVVFGVFRIVQQIRRGNFIHNPNHFQANQLLILSHESGVHINKAVWVSDSTGAEKRQKTGQNKS